MEGMADNTAKYIHMDIKSGRSVWLEKECKVLADEKMGEPK